jgi:5'-deoxynucleotidase YfbR-like HD superfamily hydrolase
MLDSALQFLLECDKLKAIERRSRPVGMARRENSAEHSWRPGHRSRARPAAGDEDAGAA